MRKIIILILFIFMSLSCQAKEVIYLDKSYNKEASKILYESELKDLNVTSDKALEVFGFKLSDVRAVFYDLNSDGVDEVIGYINARYYYGVLGWQLFILRQNNNEYINISSINFYPQEGLHILKDKSVNGYSAIGFFEGPNQTYKVLKYNNSLSN